MENKNLKLWTDHDISPSIGILQSFCGTGCSSSDGLHDEGYDVTYDEEDGVGQRVDECVSGATARREGNRAKQDSRLSLNLDLQIGLDMSRNSPKDRDDPPQSDITTRLQERRRKDQDGDLGHERRPVAPPHPALGRVPFDGFRGDQTGGPADEFA